MLRRFYTRAPATPEERKSVDDFLAFRFPEQTLLDNYRKQLALIRGEVLALERRGSQQGLANLKFEAVKLSGEIERLEARLGLRFKPSNDLA